MTWVLIALPILFGCEIIEPAEVSEPEPGQLLADGVAVVDGIDHSLPGWVEPEDFAGYVGHPDDPGEQVGTVYRNWYSSWAQLEPERGQYDWDLIEAKLAQAEAGGYKLQMHIFNLTLGGGDPDRGVNIPSAVPDWVLEEFDLQPTDCFTLNGEWGIRVIPAWRPDIRAAYHELILALGERGIPQREALGTAYIHGISPSQGEEFWLEPWMVDMFEAAAGFSATVMQEWIEERMDAYATAYGSEAHKLAWVGKCSIWHYSGEDYRDAAWNLVQHAWSVGAGNRSSAVEAYHLWLTEPALGQSIDEDGYLHTDESIPPIAEGRYFGDENEEYGDGWTWRFGDTTGDWQRYRFAMLRALQMQMRFLWTHGPAEQVDPALSSYARYSLGKTVQTSADAWCYLKESAIGRWVAPAGKVKNFERWLYQRDVPGGMTVPCRRVDRDFNAGSIGDAEEGAFHDLTARRTDLAGGQDAIYFDLDDRFATSGPVEIKVEVVDASRASWHLEYADASGQRVSSGAYIGAGDGAVRTVSFTLDDARFQGELEHGMDFRILCEGPGDVTVRWVRLVRLEAPY